MLITTSNRATSITANVGPMLNFDNECVRYIMETEVIVHPSCMII